MDRAHPVYRLPSYWPEAVLLAALALCAGVFVAALALPRVDNQIIGSDGIRYYVYIRSLAIDHDLNFSNEYEHFYGAAAAAKIEPTASGKPGNQHAIGSAILWAPFFLGAHLLALAGRAASLPVRADGYGSLYQCAICLGSVIYGFIGLILSYDFARRFTTATAALWATLLIWFGGNVLYYMVVEPSMSHMNSLFAVALFLYIWERGRGDLRPRRWLLLGALAGLMTLVRTQDGLFVLAPLLELAEMLWKRRPGADLRRAAVAVLLLGIGLAVVMLPQFAVWQNLYGKPFVSPYVQEGSFAWTSPHFLQVLFSARHGLYSWHPLFLLATGGLALLVRRDRWLVVTLLLCAVGQVFILGSWNVWWLGDAFGMRALINCTVIFVLGLALLIDVLLVRWPQPALWGLAALLLAWNGLFILQYRFGFIGMDRALTWQELTFGKLLIPLRPTQILQRLSGR